MKCFIAGLCKISLSKRLLSVLFPLNAQVWSCYSSCLMEHFTTMRIFTLDRGPSAESFYPFSAVHIPKHSCWKVKSYQKYTGNRKVLFIISFSPTIMIVFKYYCDGIWYVSDWGGKGVGTWERRTEVKPKMLCIIHWNQRAERKEWYPRKDTDKRYQIKCNLWMDYKPQINKQLNLCNYL